jgi:HlyD family secretion protein
MKKIKNYVLLSIVSVLTFSSCQNEEKKEKTESNAKPKEITKVIGIAKIEPENGLLFIYANSSGTITSISYNESEKVHKSDVLIELDNKTELSQLALEKSKISTQNSSEEYSEENLKTVNADLQKAKEDLILSQNLFNVKAITEQSLNDSKAKVKKLITEYNKQLSDIKQTKSKRNEIESNINYRNVLLSEKKIKAPLNGKILQWDIHLGDYITAGQKIGQFAPDGDLVAVTEVDELYADKIKLGMKAEVISQLDGQKIADGEVIFMADFLKKKSLFSDENTVEDRRVRTVKVRLSQSSKAIINARVDCIIKLK